VNTVSRTREHVTAPQAEDRIPADGRVAVSVRCAAVRLLTLVAAAILMAGGIAGAVASNATTASHLGTTAPFLAGVWCVRSALRRSPPVR
jgi:hypothetical protein